ncbi:hypothetical protein [Microvirga yunnanensis]|uniref:hypothetical protein n=1 Tax=Microvirga yunnanensis TaxID=2953740 RepID=UPI0021C9D4F8|nr:hypothetical protein [Microvirga sp. HBU67655]
MSSTHLPEPIPQPSFPPRRSRKKKSGAERAATSRLNREAAGRPDKRQFDCALGDAVIEALREVGVNANEGGFTHEAVQALRNHPDLRRVMVRALSILKATPKLREDGITDALMARLGAGMPDDMASRDTTQP